MRLAFADSANTKPMDPSAFFMNLFKHHALWLRPYVEMLALERTLPDQQLLNKIGSSQMDLYLGTLSPENIYQELAAQLQNKGVHTPLQYAQWLLPGEYHKLEISDTSQWILKKRNHIHPYIHLHPARYSPHSIRIKASTLRTTLLAATYYKLEGALPGLDKLNELRVEKLRLSPAQAISYNTRLLEMLCN